MESWLDELEERAGPLYPAARAFCAAWHIDPSVRGVGAAEALGRALDTFCHEPEGDDPYQEDHFIEGAGAYLGLLVLDAHGGPGHAQRQARHRVLLGAYGTFDPFAAIDAALDAEAPLLSLAESLTLAEAEAKGVGPVSTLVSALHAALDDAETGRTVSRRFELDVELDDGTQVDLRRVAAGAVWPHSREEQLRLGRDVRRLVGMLPSRRGPHADRAGPLDAAAREAILGRLLPRPVALGFGSQLPAGVALATTPIGEDIVLAFVEQHVGRARFLREDELAALGGLSCVRRAARKNLEGRSTQMRFEPLALGEHRWLAGKTGDGLDADRLLLAEAHELARQLLPNVGVAVVPHRDTILFAPAEDAAALEHYARDLLARAPHPISARPVRLSDGLSAWG